MAETFEVRWSAIAVADVEDILRYTARNWSPRAARALHAALRRKVRTLAKHPRRCRVVPELQRLGVFAFREMIASPHRLVFRLEGKIVTLVAVLDGRRDLEELLLARALGWQ